MRVPRFVKIVGWIFLTIAAFWIWYSIAADYSYGAVSGTYTLRRNAETATLVLTRDQRFQEDLLYRGKLLHAQGSWHRSGEGGIDFSSEFIKIPGEEFDASGVAYGYIYKRLGLFLSIVLAPDPGGPTFHKKLFG